jgi:hypothetical protein
LLLGSFKDRHNSVAAHANPMQSLSDLSNVISQCVDDEAFLSAKVLN